MTSVADIIGGILIVGCCAVAPNPGVAQCENRLCNGDQDRNGTVAINELIGAVSNALDGCKSCVDISGVWDYTYSTGTCAGGPGMYTLTITQHDDCTFEGTLAVVDSPEISYIVDAGTISNQGLSFVVLLAGQDEVYSGKVLSNGQTMGGQFTKAGCEYNWTAARPSQ